MAYAEGRSSAEVEGAFLSVPKPSGVVVAHIHATIVADGEVNWR